MPNGIRGQGGIPVLPTNRWRLLVVLALVLSTVAAGCGGSPTAEGEADTTKSTEATDAENAAGKAALQKVYDAVAGLGPKERRAKLTELAEAEEGTFSLYGSTNLDEAEPILAAFDDAAGLEPNLYRASSSDLLQRVIQEAKASFDDTADVVYTNGPELQVLDDEGLLLPLESPYEADLVKETIVSENWAPIYLNVFTAAWNTKRVPAGDAPKTWEEVLTSFKGHLAMEVGDWDWFATLTKGYFTEQKGMTEKEAVDLFKDAAKGARMIDGHTLMTELLSAGEFNAVSSAYKHRVAQLKRDGAPVEWEPAVQPIVVRPNGIAIMASTDTPASALLFVDFMMTDVQKMLIDFDRTPASNAVPGGGIPAKYDVLVADLRALGDERDKWEGLYEEIAQESGEVVED
jgi:iron(III) transport system substrate-binding protein